MFEQYDQKTNQELIQNKLVQQLANEKQWTVSDKEKKPVDARYLLDTNNVRNARVLDDPYPLVTLHELNESPNLIHTNRAYRLQSQNNNIIVIDVEPHADKDMLMMSKNFPAHYTEISRNGGVHLLIEVPERIKNAENSYLFDTVVVKNKAGDMEVILNDHFITFTKRIVTDKPIADFENNPEQYAQLEKFLANIVKMDEEAKIDRELKRQMAVEFTDENLDVDTINKVIKSLPFSEFIERQKEKDPKSFTDKKGSPDWSRYEGSISTACAGHIFRFTKNLKSTVVLKDTFGHLTENDWIYASYLMLKEIVPTRDKHTEVREGMPWLLFNSQSAWQFILAQEEKKKLEKKRKKK